jgi:hypothetical protein
MHETLGTVPGEVTVEEQDHENGQGMLAVAHGLATQAD